MPDRPIDVVVVGAGVGGLCAAIRLAAAGRSVTVLERNEVATSGSPPPGCDEPPTR